MSKKRLSKEALVDLVSKIMNPEGTEEELDQYMVLLKQNVPHPGVSDLIFYPDKELSPDEIVEIALSYKGIAVPGKKLNSLVDNSKLNWFGNMTVHIRNSYPQITEEYLDQIEMHCRFSFPVQYKNFILSHNGGRPKQNVFRARTGEMLMVDWFLGIHNDEHDNLLTYLRLYRDRIPSELLSIAHDAGGNLICIGVSGDARGKLFFWDHEKETSEANASYDNVTYIAENFDEFLQMLKELEDLDKSGSR